MRYQFLTVTVPYYDPALERIVSIRCNFAPKAGLTGIDRRHVRKLLRKLLKHEVAGVTSGQCAQLIAHGIHRTYDEVKAALKAHMHAVANRMEDEANEDESLGHTQVEAASAAGTGV